MKGCVCIVWVCSQDGSAVDEIETSHIRGMFGRCNIVGKGEVDTAWGRSWNILEEIIKTSTPLFDEQRVKSNAIGFMS